MSIARIAEKAPGGILIFFSSYRVMENCYNMWADFNILDDIEKHKVVLKEPKDPS